MKRFTILGILTIFVVLLIISGCIGEVTPSTTSTPTITPLTSTAPSATGSVHGIVTEKGTGKPLSDVMITGDIGYAVTTGSDGSYRITGLAPGYNAFEFTKEGYIGIIKSVEIVAGQDKECNVKMVNSTATQKLLVIQDAYISQGGSNGSASFLGIGDYLTSFDTRMLFQFDISSIPLDVKVISAKLKLGRFDTNPFSGDPIPYVVYPVKNGEDWNESAVTWNLRKSSVFWSTPGGSFDETYEISMGNFPLGSTSQWEKVDVAKAFEYWKTHDNNGIMVKTTHSTTAWVMFISKDSLSTESHPYVEVTYYIP